MDWLASYQDSTDTALRVMASRPVEAEPPKPKHSAWSAVPRAVASAATEIGGNIIDTAAAYGQVAAASGGLTPGFDPDQTKNRAASVEAMDKLKTEGIDWRTEESQTQYAYARDLRPDPVTAGHAENLVFGLTRGLTKAIGAATTLGPVAGALAFGGSEGMTDADSMAAQGVDLATRTKVGAVSAAMNAAGVALPVAGKTLAQTAVLVAVGGPLSFMTQQQATRSILEAADYHDIAKQYDPLDPVGLTVATLVPAGFAAVARAGARSSAKTPDIVPTRDDIDAAMVHNLTTLRDVHESVSAEIASNGNSGITLGEPAKITWQSGKYTFTETRTYEHRADDGRISRTTIDEAGNSKKEWLIVKEDGTELWAEAAGNKDDYAKVTPDQAQKIANEDLPANRTETSLPAVDQVSQPKPAKPAEDVTPDAYRARVDQLAKEQPDLVSRLDDAGQPVKLADELAAVRKAAQEGTDTEFGALDAPLLKVAAECALATGTAAL